MIRIKKTNYYYPNCVPCAPEYWYTLTVDGKVITKKAGKSETDRLTKKDINEWLKRNLNGIIETEGCSYGDRGSIQFSG